MAYFDNVEHLTKVPKINRTLNYKNEDEIIQLVHEVMPSWPTESIQIQKMEGGIINRMFIAKSELDSENKLIVRIYFGMEPENKELAERLDRTRELKNLEKIRGLNIGPELLAVFNNGLCYKYLEGDTLNVNTVRTEEMIPYVIKLIAKLHSLPLPDWTSAWDITNSEFLVANFPPDLRNPERTEKLLEIIPNKEALLKELRFIGELASSIPQIYVYCHTDSKGENFIWNKETKTLHLIDFEHSGKSNQIFEIASHFVSFTDVLNPQPNCFPSREFQLKWLRMYLKEYYAVTGKNPDDVTEDEVNKYYIHVNRAALLSKFFLGLACLSLVTNNVFDSFEFCMLHLKEYFQSKSFVSSL